MLRFTGTTWAVFVANDRVMITLDVSTELDTSRFRVTTVRLTNV